MLLGTLTTPTLARQMAPAFFIKFCIEFLGSDKKLAVAVWSRLFPSADLLWQLVRVDNLRPGSVEAFAKHLTPADLMAACERLVKVQGRTKALIALEEAILQRIDRHGAWR